MSQKYANPPIKEAVFDFQIRGGDPFSHTAYQEFLDKNSRYVVAGKVQDINVSAETQPIAKTEVTGYRSSNEDKTQISQFKKTGFSFSRLQPYIGWDKSYEEAMRLWQIYCELRKPQTITRLAVRFINQFQIPDIFTKPSEYFNGYIQYDKSISPNWNQMSYKLLLSHNQGIKSHIISDALVNQHNLSVNVLLDIDVFSDGLVLPAKELSGVEKVFKELREIKNNIFEKNITDKIRKMIA